MMGGQSLKLSTKGAVFKRVSLLFGGARPSSAPALGYIVAKLSLRIKRCYIWELSFI